MNKKIILLLSVFFIVLQLSLSSFAVSAESAVTLNMMTGKFIFEKNGDRVLPMASTTKIMTAIIAIEQAPLDTICKVSKKAEDEEGSQIGLEKGDRVKLEDLLYMLMLKSANDAAVTIAENISGSTERFAEKMNEYAEMLNLKNTHFANPNGLPSENHYTTAKELAQITAYALKNPTFKTIVSTKTKRLEYHSLSISNSNRLLRSYEGTIGVKTGFTKEAGRCLVTAAERDGTILINVTLNAPDDWNDHKNLFENGFEKSGRYVLYKKGEYTVKKPVLNGKNHVFFYNTETIYGYYSGKDKELPKIEENLLPLYFAPIEENFSGGYLTVKHEGFSEKIPMSSLYPVEEHENSLSFFEKYVFFARQLLKKVLP